MRDALQRERNAYTLGRLARFTDVALGDQDSARQLYEESLGMEPNDAWTNGRLADLLQRAGGLEAARRHFELAIQGEHPDHAH